MIFLARNAELTKNREKTYLTASVAVAGTTLTVKAVNTNAWTNADYIIVGEIGAKNAEITNINAAVANGTSITTAALIYAHSIDEPVYRIDYNQIQFFQDTVTDATKDATWITAHQLSTTKDIQPDDEFTRYEDTVNTTGYGFIRFKNSTTTTYSSFSDAIPYTGYTPKSLGRMIRMVRRHLNEPDVEAIDDEDIMEEINEKQRDVAHERLWPFYEDIFSASTVKYQRVYGISSFIADGKVHALTCKSTPLIKIDKVRDDILHWDTAAIGEPTHFGIWNNDIRLYPTPDSDANTDTLDGAITASATIILLDSTLGFQAEGRVIIDSEVISYTNLNLSTKLDGTHTAVVTTITVDSTTNFPSAGTITIGSEDITYTGTGATTFTGCTRGANSTTAVAYSDEEPVSATTLNGCIRGLEMTTAATHSDATTVTDRDIIYSGHREPDELVDTSDETNIPDPMVLVYGSAMELAIGKLGDQVLHDRFKMKYDQSLDRLRDKFGRKATYAFYRIKDKEEVVTDTNRLRNPNDFPLNLT